jgi:transposase
MISYFVGIDVSKATLDVAIWPQAFKPFQVKNDPEGFKQLIDCLSELKIERILLEATGGYERAVFKALQVKGLNVTRINPKRSRDYANAIGQIAKTDRIDAQMLAKFAEHIDPSLKIEPNPKRDELGELVKLRDQLVQHRDDDKRRIKQAMSKKAIAFLKKHITYLDTQIKKLEKNIRDAMNALDSEKAQRLMSVKGIGLISCATLMAFFPELGMLPGRKIAALAGLAPYNNDSGKKSGPRAICGGRHKIRRVLYMASWTMTMHVPEVKTRYNALLARGKVKKVAAVACMRVLLVRLNAMLRDGTEWKEQAPAA